MHEIREVRVTSRKTIKRDFIAPELSPVATVQTELAKGLTGWTDHDVRVQDLTGSHLPKGMIAERLDETTAGTPIKRQRREMRVASHTGPRPRRSYR